MMVCSGKERLVLEYFWANFLAIEAPVPGPTPHITAMEVLLGAIWYVLLLEKCLEMMYGRRLDVGAWAAILCAMEGSR